MLEKFVERFDGWFNALTGLGTSRDKIEHSSYCPSRTIGDDELSSLFTSDDLAKKLVTMRNNEMLRKGYRIESDSVTLPTLLRERAAELGYDQALLEAMNLGKLYGGSLLILGIDGNPSEPVAKINDISYINVVDRRDAQPVAVFDNPLTIEFNKPSQYRLMNGSIVHADRCQRFGGSYTEPRRKRALNGWDVSILQDAYTILSIMGQSWQAVANMLVSASEGVFKIKDLMRLIAEDKSDTLEKRMILVSMQRSAARDLMLDADGEDYHREQIAFQGIASILEIMMMRLAALADVPVTKLFGRAPAGLNATGDADIRLYYDSVETEQKNKLHPVLLRFYQMLAQSSGLTDKFTIEFNSLWSADPKTEAETAKLQSETDATYHEIGVLEANEIRQSRFGVNAGQGIVLDVELDEPTTEPTTEPIEPVEQKEEPVGTVALTATTTSEVLTLNEVRASLPVPHVAWGKDPGQDPADGYLPVFAFKAKQQAVFAPQPAIQTDALSIHELTVEQAAESVDRKMFEDDAPSKIAQWSRLSDEDKKANNPPQWVLDEDCWEKAKGVADKTDPSDYWSFVAWLYVYHFSCEVS